MNTQQKSTKQTMVTIGGMSCTGCANTIQEALESKEGVIGATADLDNDTVSVIYDPQYISTDDFKQVVEGAGYDFVDIG